MRWAIGIDLGGTNIKAAAVDGFGQPFCQLRVPTLAEQGVDRVVDQLGTLVNELCNRVQAGPPAGIGIGVPGTVDRVLGLVILAPNLNWQAVPLQELLAKRYDLGVVLENDAQAAALGEHWAGAGKGVQHMLMVTIGTGIGSGLILHGRLHRGHTGRGPELGHSKLLADPGCCCGCGNTGCLETLSSGSAIVKALTEVRQDTGEKTLNKLNARAVIQKAAAGDPLAEKAVELAMTSLGTAIANLCLILDLELILVGGGVAEAGEYLMAPLRERITGAMSPYPPPKVGKGALGNWAGAVGAARLAFLEDLGKK
ncbi:MAG: ROK family protein [Bacillota bacterium]